MTSKDDDAVKCGDVIEEGEEEVEGVEEDVVDTVLDIGAFAWACRVENVAFVFSISHASRAVPTIATQSGRPSFSIDLINLPITGLVIRVDDRPVLVVFVV